MGFYSPIQWTKQRRPMPVVAQCGRCRLHEKCNSPFMAPVGDFRRKTLIVGEGPGFHEDQRGEPFVGSSGYDLTVWCHRLGVNLRRDCRITNAIICRATDEGGQNRKPTNDEVAYCRPNVIALIEELRPELIILLGLSAVKSVLAHAWRNEVGEYDNMERWAGWVIPSCKLNAWVCPTYHPAFIARERERNAAAESIVQGHLRAAFACRGRPHPDGPPDYKKRVKLCVNPDEALPLLRDLTGVDRPVAFDFETDRLKPYHRDARILSCSLSDGVTTFAYPWAGAAVAATSLFLQSRTPKVGANIPFEENWCWRRLRHGVANWRHDVVLGQHALRCHRGVCGVKFQSFVLFGVEDYDSYLDAFKKSEEQDSNAPNRLTKVGVRDLLLYNGLDSLYEWMISKHQAAKLGRQP